MMNDNQKTAFEGFMRLPQPATEVQCQYVWVDGSLRNLRTKSRSFPSEPKSPEELPVIEFCGSGTDFDVGNVSDFYSHPVKIYRDPFRRGSNKLIFCETRTREGLPTFANNRHRLMQLVEKEMSLVQEFSFYQSYTLLGPDMKPLSYMKDAYNLDSKSGFCCGREIAESHYRACLYAGVKMSSLEPVSNQGQWKYAVGPCRHEQLGDDAWMSRFLLIRVAEDFGVSVIFESSNGWSCLKTISSKVELGTDHLIPADRQRIIDNLHVRFGMNDHPLKISSTPSKIIVKEIRSDIDPYAFITKLLETINTVAICE